MAKSNKFKKGDLVSGNRFNGEPFIGIYEYEYDCGDHCVSNTTIKFCVHKNKIQKATPEEEELIKETIIKPMREEKKRKALEELKKKQEEELEQEDMETLASEPTDEELEKAFESSETNDEKEN